MHGSLSLRSGVLYVGRHELTAHVKTYDLDGRPLGPGFSFRGPRDGPARVGGLDVDGDRRLWIADPVARRVRTFNVFGREVGGFGAAGTPDRKAATPGSLEGLVDLCLMDSEEQDLVLVTQGGERRHGAQVFRVEDPAGPGTQGGRWVASLRPRGEAQGTFRGLRRAASRGRMIWLCEAGAGCVQVYRDREFHFLFKVPVRPGGRFEPTAVAPLADGRLVLATGGPDSALLLLDAGGRLLHVIAEAGTEAGAVHEPEDIALEAQGADAGAGVAPARLAVIDRDAERVQVFTVEGGCFGALVDLPG